MRQENEKTGQQNPTRTNQGETKKMNTPDKERTGQQGGNRTDKDRQ